MKQLLLETPHPPEHILLSKLADNNLIGLIDKDGDKYILSARNSYYAFVDGKYYFLCEMDSKSELLTHMLANNYKLFVFDDIKELGKWLTE